MTKGKSHSGRDLHAERVSIMPGTILTRHAAAAAASRARMSTPAKPRALG